MKTNIRSIFLLFLLLVALSFVLNGQIKNTFNNDIYNGLPSNRVYHVITDRYGYLWVTTEKGVVRYNGYEFKLFDLSDGLPTADIYEMFEDKKGRIWLGNLSDEIGYIYNNKYHKTYIRNYKGGLYPGILSDFGDGIIFFSRVSTHMAVCIERNDTIDAYLVRDMKCRSVGQPDRSKEMIHMMTYGNAHPAGVLVCGNVFYDICFDNRIPYLTEIMQISPSNSFLSYSRMTALYDNKLVSYIFGPLPRLQIIDFKAGCIEEAGVKEHGITCNPLFFYTDLAEQCRYIVTEKRLIKYNLTNHVKPIQILEVDSFVTDSRVNGNVIRPVHYDPFWGLCMGTTNVGLWRHYDTKNYFTPVEKLNLDNFKFIGQDENCYWWNYVTHTLAWGTDPEHMTYKIYDSIKDTKFYSVVLFNKDTLLFTGNYAHFFAKKSNKLIFTRLYAGVSSYVSDRKIMFAGVSGFHKGTYVTDSGFSLQLLSENRYTGLSYDSLRKTYWAYNNDNVFIYREDGSAETLVSNENLSRFGVRKVEKIVIDNTYGNLFFKGTDNITLYDREQTQYTEILKRYNVKDAVVFIHNSTLIVAGRFGILFCKIAGYGKLSSPLVYRNLKNVNYNFIYDCQVMGGKVLLKTDKGAYTVALPQDNDILYAEDNDVAYKLILNYNDTQTCVIPGDTIEVFQNDQRLQFDIINPLGTGKVNYHYKLQTDNGCKEMLSNQLTLPSLIPDKYYLLSITVNDDSWRSDTINLYVYIAPYWWQTQTGKKLMWAGVAALVIALFAIAVIITRKVVLKANARRNMQMELELKAIYAQINPHFIFNTLNSALSLVRKKRLDEAYEHISQFSRLLRSYIKSSRNKLITIADEISNLRDYLELQRTRFGNKFEYCITVSESIQPELVKIPSLLLQPFVENALNHGLLNKVEKGMLNIEFKATTDKKEIICTIDDDGVGRKHSQATKGTDTDPSYGDLLIKDLVSIFNKYEQMNIEIKYFDKEIPETGTIVMIHIKNPHYD